MGGWAVEDEVMRGRFGIQLLTTPRPNTQQAAIILLEVLFTQR